MADDPRDEKKDEIKDEAQDVAEDDIKDETQDVTENDIKGEIQDKAEDDIKDEIQDADEVETKNADEDKGQAEPESDTKVSQTDDETGCDAKNIGDGKDKILSFIIPCYNSIDYMDRCIQSILDGIYCSGDVEIIIVDDGSTDGTPEHADELVEAHPSFIKVVHQENGGHGMAILGGLEKASGTFIKIVDSDDWVNQFALGKLLEEMRQTERDGKHIDLFVTNYTYEHTESGKSNTVKYRHILPRNKIFEWKDIKRFPPTQNLLMHSLCYRAEVLRDGGIPLPAHTFYVDSIYAWVPLPRCRNICYLDLNLYHYFIGREDQSVNEKVMAGRIDQQRRVTRIMMGAYHPYDDVHPRQLRRYMVNYFVIMMTICTIFSYMSEQPDALEELDVLWDDLKGYDKRLWRRCRYGMMGILTNLPSKGGGKVAIGGYRIARKLVKFN